MILSNFHMFIDYLYIIQVFCPLINCYLGVCWVVWVLSYILGINSFHYLNCFLFLLLFTFISGNHIIHLHHEHVTSYSFSDTVTIIISSIQRNESIVLVFNLRGKLQTKYKKKHAALVFRNLTANLRYQWLQTCSTFFPRHIFKMQIVYYVRIIPKWLYFLLFMIKYRANFSFFFIYCCSSTVVSIFIPPWPPPHPSPPPTLEPIPLGFVLVSFICVPWWPFPYFPPLSSPASLLVTVSLFFIPMSLVIFCLLVCFVD